MDIVTKLTELYTEAISFYNSHKDNRFKFYEKKLQNMMTRSNVLQAMANFNPSQE